MLLSRINTLNRQDHKSHTRVAKLEKVKTTVIDSKVRREEIK